MGSKGLILASLYFNRVTVDCKFRHFIHFKGDQCILTKSILVILQYSLSLGIDIVQMVLFK